MSPTKRLGTDRWLKALRICLVDSRAQCFLWNGSKERNVLCNLEKEVTNITRICFRSLLQAEQKLCFSYVYSTLSTLILHH